MTPDEIDKILAKATDRAPSPVADRAAIQRIEGAILQDLRPVRPLAPAWVFMAVLIVLFAAFAAATASALGLHGIHALSEGQLAVIFPTLLAAAWLSAVACEREMRPASGSHLGAAALIFTAGGFAAVISQIFHGYGSEHFVSEGIPCLVAGLCVAIPTGVAIAWIVRRGFVLDWSSAGIAAGTLAGLTGLAMLELHCPNLKAIHVMVWHVAVVIVTGILGFVIGKTADFFRRGAV
jgi:hypothetical protein